MQTNVKSAPDAFGPLLAGAKVASSGLGVLLAGQGPVFLGGGRSGTARCRAPLAVPTAPLLLRLSQAWAVGCSACPLATAPGWPPTQSGRGVCRPVLQQA